MNQREQKFYKRLRDTVFCRIPGFLWDRVENREHATGMPDIAYSYAGHHGWIELKSVENKGVRLLDPMQMQWLKDRGNAGGGNCLALMQIGPLFVLQDHLGNDLEYWHDKIEAQKLAVFL